jgi:ferredoxin
MFEELLLDKIAEQAAGPVQFLPRRCLRARFHKNQCLLCLEECRTGALTLQGATVCFAPGKCTGCLRCAAVCPNDAFPLEEKLLPLLQAINRGGHVVVVGCDRNRGDLPRYTVPCLGIFSEPLLAAMNCLAGNDILLDGSGCAGCVNGHCVDTVLSQLENFSQRQGRQGRGAAVRIKLMSERDHPAVGRENNARRLFLKELRRSLSAFGAQSTGGIHGGAGEANRIANRSPVAVSAALQYAVAHAPAGRESLLAHYFFTLTADSRCDLCPLCSGMCPTGAISRSSIEAGKSLLFTSAACSGCGLCRDFCPRQALSLSRGFSGDPNAARRIR